LASNLSIVISARDLSSNVLKGIGNSANTMGSKIASIGKTMAIGLAAGSAALAGLGALSIKAASDLSESQSKVGVVFGESAGEIEEFASRAAQALGQSKAEAMASAGTFGNLFVSMGLGQQEAAGLSKDIITLGADLGSFNNIESGEALEKLRAGLVGEAEPLRALGVNMNAAMVEAKGMELGLADANGELSEAAKVQARYALIMEQTKTAQGDFANTSTGMANATKIIQASFADVQSQIGEQLLPVIAPLISAFAKALPGAMETLKPILASVGEIVKKLASGDFKGAFDGMMGIITDIGGKMGVQLQEWGEQLWSWIEPMIPPMLVKAGELATQLLTWVANQIPPLIEQLAAWGAQLWAWIEPMIPPMLREAGKLLSGLLDWIGDEGPKLATTFIREWVPAAIGWVAQTAIDIIPKLLELAGAITGWILTEGVPKLLTAAINMGRAIISGVMDGAGQLAGQLYNKLLDLLSFDFGWVKLSARSGVSFDIPTPSIPNPFGGGGGGGSSADQSEAEADWAAAGYPDWAADPTGHTSVFGTPIMDAGGVVPGPYGALVPVMARGGEQFGGWPPRRSGNDRPIVIHNYVMLDGRQVAQYVTTEQQYQRSIG
jgi:hypothetical protein